MSAGAFSDATVMEAADRIACIFVECGWGKKNADLSDRYKVSGYPTVYFCDPDGKPIAELESHEPPGVAKQMLAIAAKFGAKPDGQVPLPKIAAPPVSEALEKKSKPVAIFFRDDSPASLSITAALGDPLLKDTLSRFTLALSEYEKGSAAATKYDVTRAPTIVVVDPTLEKPEARPLAKIAGSRSARELQRDFEEILAALAPKAADPSAAKPAPRGPEERLSDDEIERRFIQARVAVALDLIKRGKKAKAIEVYEDILKSYPKHVDTATVKKLLEEARK